MNKKLKHGWLVTLIFSVISLLYLYPIILVVINSFKKKAYISRVPFDLQSLSCAVPCVHGLSAG